MQLDDIPEPVFVLKVVERAVKFIEATFHTALLLLKLCLIVVVIGVVWFVGHVSWGIYQAKQKEAERVEACHFVPDLTVQIGKQVLTLEASTFLQINPKAGPRIRGETIADGDGSEKAFCLPEPVSGVLPAHGFLYLSTKGFDEFLLRKKFEAMTVSFFSVYALRPNSGIPRPYNEAIDIDHRVHMGVIDVRGDLLVEKVLQANGIDEDGFRFTTKCSKLDGRTRWHCTVYAEDHNLQLGYRFANVEVDAEEGFWIDAHRVYKVSSEEAKKIRVIVSDFIQPKG